MPTHDTWYYNKNMNLPSIVKAYLKPALRQPRKRMLARLYRHNLVRLATIFRTDKWNGHWYIPLYERYFRPLRFKRLNIVEIGVGGYEDPKCGGHSLRMWKAYFPKSHLYGIDCYDKRELEEPRIRIFHGWQEDTEFLRHVVKAIGRVDIVIDDGSHVNAHVITAFETLFPLLADDGIYVVEDTQTSYWPGRGGSSELLNDPTTTMGYFKCLVDGLNHAEFLKPGYQPSYFDQHITAMHFYRNLIFILKGNNTEGSNFLRDNTTTEPWILNS